jgi:hypothetical protein
MFINLCYKYLIKQIPQADIVESSHLMPNKTHEAVGQQMNERAHTGSSYNTHIWKFLLLTVNTICLSLTGTQKEVQVEEKTVEVEKWWARRRGLREVYLKNVSGYWQRLPMKLLFTGPDSCLQMSPKGREATSFLWYHRTRAAYQTMADADGHYCRMCDSLP